MSHTQIQNLVTKLKDLYKQEESFLQMVESRTEDYVENWLQTLDCPVIKIDGTKPINVEEKYGC